MFQNGGKDSHKRSLIKCCMTDLCNVILPPIPRQNVTIGKFLASRSFESLTVILLYLLIIFTHQFSILRRVICGNFDIWGVGGESRKKAKTYVMISTWKET